jgi:hypothetical protein
VTIKILGKVQQTKTHAAIAGQRVEAWAHDPMLTKVLGVADTKNDGSFSIEISDFATVTAIAKTRPLVYFKLRKNESVVFVSGFLWSAKTPDTQAVIEVDLAQAQSGLSVVRGRIQAADGQALSGATVRAFDKDLRSEQDLGNNTTDADGNYLISYSPDQFKRAEKLQADLIVRVFNAYNTLVVESGVLFNAADDVTVNLLVGAGAVSGSSEFEQLVAEITPALDGVAFQDLTDADVTFLEPETGVSAEQIVVLRACFKSQQSAQIPAAAFYAFERAGLGATFAAVLTASDDAWRAALTGAVATGVVSGSLSYAVEPIVAKLRTLRAQASLSAAPDPALTPLQGTLSLTLTSDADRQAVASVFASNQLASAPLR